MTFLSPSPVSEDLTSALLCVLENAPDKQLYLILHHAAEDFQFVSSEARHYLSLVGSLEDFEPIERLKCKNIENPEKMDYYLVFKLRAPIGIDVEVNEWHIGRLIWLL